MYCMIFVGDVTIDVYIGAPYKNSQLVVEGGFARITHQQQKVDVLRKTTRFTHQHDSQALDSFGPCPTRWNESFYIAFIYLKHLNKCLKPNRSVYTTSALTVLISTLKKSYERKYWSTIQL